MEMYTSCKEMETHETGGAKEDHNVPTNKLWGVLNIFNQISLSLEEMGAAHHSCKKCFCLREPIFWGRIFLILRRNFPNMDEDFPNIEEKFS